MSLSRRELLCRLSVLSGAGLSWLILARSGFPASKGATNAEIEPHLAPQPSSTTTTPAVLWDGVSGATGTMFNKGAQLPWEHVGGDWFDAHGVPQGETTLAVLQLNSVGLHEVDLSPFADRVSLGLLLRGRGGVRVATRRHPDPASSPVLICDGVEIPCRASAPLSRASSMPQVTTESNLGNRENMALQFDVPAEAKSVKFRLTVTKMFSGNHSADVLLLRVPRLFVTGELRQGLAAKYKLDAGINSDPAVYFSTKFNDDWKRTLFPEGRIIGPAVVAHDAQLGVPALSSHYLKGEVGGMGYIHKWSSRNPHMRPGTTDPTPSSRLLALNHPGAPEELYFRYYLMLGPGYQCSVEGKKLPGLAWRYGYWYAAGAGGGYYYPVCGNGGSKSTGLLRPNPTSGLPPILCGGSMRHLAHVGPPDGNPLKERVALGYYAYHAEMVGPWGDFWRWGDAKIGFVNIEQGRWYCVEHRLRMNSIDMSAPDALGNGKGNPDGIVQGWLDGVLVFDKRDVVMRHHPAFKVDEVWLDMYHGGLTPAEAEHPYKIAALVVAKQYIGPMRTGASSA